MLEPTRLRFRTSDLRMFRHDATIGRAAMVVGVSEFPIWKPKGTGAVRCLHELTG